MRTIGFLILVTVALSSRLIASQDAVVILDKAPIWTSITADDQRTGQLVCETLRPLLEKDPAELRNILVKYVAGLRADDPDKLGSLSKIFVLNRMFFNVPDDDRLDNVQFFGGWNGVPFGNGKVNMMWPVSMTKEGGFKIAGYFCGYFGPEYSPLDEFDFLLKRYGKRKLPVTERK
jgi:hypothetical protein